MAKKNGKKPGNRLVWTFQVILFLAFLFFGIAKYVVSPETASQVFGKIGGSTAQYFTGAYQTISAFLVIFPVTAFLGALLIAISMIVAIVLHITILGLAGPNAVLTIIAAVLLLMAIYVMKKRRKDLFRKR